MLTYIYSETTIIFIVIFSKVEQNSIINLVDRDMYYICRELKFKLWSSHLSILNIKFLINRLFDKKKLINFSSISLFICIRLTTLFHFSPLDQMGQTNSMLKQSGKVAPRNSREMLQNCNCRELAYNNNFLLTFWIWLI
jgi:hypothetical protein